jgi:hypothetical protein
MGFVDEAPRRFVGLIQLVGRSESGGFGVFQIVEADGGPQTWADTGGRGSLGV